MGQDAYSLPWASTLFLFPDIHEVLPDWFADSTLVGHRNRLGVRQSMERLVSCLEARRGTQLSVCSRESMDPDGALLPVAAQLVASRLDFLLSTERMADVEGWAHRRADRMGSGAAESEAAMPMRSVRSAEVDFERMDSVIVWAVEGRPAGPTAEAGSVPLGRSVLRWVDERVWVEEGEEVWGT